MRHHNQIRRQRILLSLGATAIITLAVATWMGSVAWLWLTIGIDIAIAVYVTGLLFMKSQTLSPSATVVPIESAQASPAQAAADSRPAYEETPTVRVIAG